jgi:hypothetical protein
MLFPYLIPLLIASLVIVALVVMLAATRRSLSTLKLPPGNHAVAEGKYPSGYWMSIGIAAGVALGVLLGLVVHALTGGISVGIGIGLILGKVLDNHFDKVDTQFTEEQKQERLRRAGWGVLVMIMLVIATLVAAVIYLLG